ncbi:hypothetical protein CLV59_105212 [Chitinophaga dinghuensis]|uniref:Uncharacterized protein n=1 Tax=Chitinophaga dinghuensis TaxID=1539050 RepID=A0A327VYY1_9BACT|nr:hypothetical protein CLV59_105212 [Chitinophaga dinghuensis]
MLSSCIINDLGEKKEIRVLYSEKYFLQNTIFISFYKIFMM